MLRLPRSARLDSCAAALAILSALTFAACSTAQPKNESISISTNDPAAHISVDGNEVGVGSASVEVARNTTHSVVAQSANGSASASISKSVSSTGWLDLLGGFLFILPWIGCFTPGFWDLDTNHVNLVLPIAAK
jgi:hypothetical protein